MQLNIDGSEMLIERTTYDAVFDFTGQAAPLRHV
jgi:hypothetical protein